ncbi:MAG: O-antigen ligase family protein [Promethearchaeota archaeon]|jgi:hypothetical protein
MASTIINIAIALLLATYAIRNKSEYSLFLSLFLYISFHYTYAVLPVFSPYFDADEYGDLHFQTLAGVKLVGFGFLFFTLGMLFRRYRQHLFYGIHYGAEKWLRTIFVLWGLMVFSHWVVDAIGGDYPTKIALQDIFSSFLMIIFAWSFGAALRTQQDLTIVIQEKICGLLLTVLLLMVAIGTWEVLSLRTFSGAYIDSGEYVPRASALLFNPNVLGFWCAFVAIFAAFTFHSKTWSRKLSALMLVLAGFGILLSGSRSGLIICLLLLGLASILLFVIRKRIREIAAFRPLLIFAAGMGTISLLLKGLDKVTGHTLKGLRAMALLVERFVDVPKQIANYGFYRFSGYGVLKNTPGSDSGFNIHSRLTATVELPDNGYLAMLQDGGWPALTAWIILWIWLAGIGIQALRKAPGVRSTYSLSVVVGCALSAMFMRAFQVFPFWVMISLALSLCMSWYAVVLGKGSPVPDNKD